MGHSRRRLILWLLLITAGALSCSWFVATVGHLDRTVVRQMKIQEGLMADEVSDAVIQKRRRQHLQNVCDFLWLESNKSALEAQSLDHIIVDDNYKLLYCYVPKVACTNWKRVLMILDGNQGLQPLDIVANNVHNKSKFRTLAMYSEQEIHHRIQHYLKFIFVRHPFERLVSAFRNKFQQEYSDYFMKRFGRLIIQRYRKDATQEALLSGHNVTFGEFVQYLVDPQTLQEEPFNEHWRPAFELCHPCKIQYDIIGKYETLEGDAEYVLRKLNVSHLVSFPKISKTVNTFQLMHRHLSSLSNEYIFKLFQLYALDFKMFDYHYGEFDNYLPD